MCLILIAVDQHDDYPLVIAANRDERYLRPSTTLAPWPDAPDILAGRDLEAGGAWLGFGRNGRFATVTNFREWPLQAGWPRSRGELVRNFLLGDDSAAGYAARHAGRNPDFAGFNLLVSDASGLWYCSNRSANPPFKLGPGYYGLANGQLGDEWPKTRSGVAALRDAIATGASMESLLNVLADRRIAADDELPSTGIDRETERLLSPRFITAVDYGTRASTVARVDRCGIATICEQTFVSGGRPDTLSCYEWAWSTTPETMHCSNNSANNRTDSDRQSDS